MPGPLVSQDHATGDTIRNWFPEFVTKITSRKAEWNDLKSRYRYLLHTIMISLEKTLQAKA